MKQQLQKAIWRHFFVLSDIIYDFLTKLRHKLKNTSWKMSLSLPFTYEESSRRLFRSDIFTTTGNWNILFRGGAWKERFVFFFESFPLETSSTRPVACSGYSRQAVFSHGLTQTFFRTFSKGGLAGKIPKKHPEQLTLTFAFSRRAPPENFRENVRGSVQVWKQLT